MSKLKTMFQSAFKADVCLCSPLDLPLSFTSVIFGSISLVVDTDIMFFYSFSQVFSIPEIKVFVFHLYYFAAEESWYKSLAHLQFP